MEYLKCLSKQDLISLLEICYEARLARSLEQFQSCFNKVKTLILFDGALSVYADKDAVDNCKIPGFFYYTQDFSDKFLKQYVKGRYYEKSAVFQAVYNTWRPQHWKTAWSRDMDGSGVSSMQLAHTYGYLDGWAHGSDHQGNSAMSVFAFAGRKVEKDKRTKAILTYLTAHLAESLKGAFHASLKKQKESTRFKLTAREMEVLKWLKNGKSSWEISVILNRSERVIKWHVQNLMQKLCAMNRTQAVAIALRNGLIA